jgi:ADP-ribose pyrophosphatase
MPQSNNPWKTLGSKVIYESPLLALYEDDVIRPNGEQGKYSYVKSPPFVLMVAFDGRRIILVKQFRYPLRKVITEFPGGSIDEGESPLEAAKRELEEETGFKAKKWTKLGSILNPNEATVFLAEDLEKGNNKMSDDGIERFLQLTRAELDDMIAHDELTDSKTLACLLLFDRYISR